MKKGTRSRCAWGCSEAEGRHPQPILLAAPCRRPQCGGPWLRIPGGTRNHRSGVPSCLASQGSRKGATAGRGIHGHAKVSLERPGMLRDEPEVCEPQVQGEEEEGKQWVWRPLGGWIW